MAGCLQRRRPFLLPRGRGGACEGPVNPFGGGVHVKWLTISLYEWVKRFFTIKNLCDGRGCGTFGFNRLCSDGSHGAAFPGRLVPLAL